MRNEALQHQCRAYLGKLSYIANKHGLGTWLRNVIRANRRHECEGTQKEVALLARMVRDESISRKDIPKILGKSYRRCNEDGDFDNLKRIEKRGTYDKVSVLLYSSKNKKKKRR